VGVAFGEDQVGVVQEPVDGGGGAVIMSTARAPQIASASITADQLA
jgi:hypothetical protein